MSTEARRAAEWLWSERPAPRRGPKQGLTLDQVINAAVGVADEQGLTGMTVSRVAGRLGVAGPALYTYVSGKAELMALMADAMLARQLLPHDQPGPWRSQIEAWAWADLAMYRRHPWLLRIPDAGHAPGPEAFRIFDSALRVFDGKGLTESEKAAAVESVDYFVQGFARYHYHDSEAESGGDPADALPRHLIDWAAYPAVRRVVDTGAVPYAPERFEFGLRILLDGLEAWMNEH